MRYTRPARITIASLATVGAATATFAAAGTATALVPDYPATIEMTITNNTAYTMFLDSDYNAFGDWIVAPPKQLAPGATETVSASTWNRGGFDFEVTYGMSEDTSATFVANNYGGRTDTDGTRVDGTNPLHWNIFSSVDQGSPNMIASYTILPPLR